MNDRRVDENGQRLRFTSSILPPYLRKTRSIEELIPWLYLRRAGGMTRASIRWTRTQPNDPEVGRFRAEAAQLLGIRQTQPALVPTPQP